MSTLDEDQVDARVGQEARLIENVPLLGRRRRGQPSVTRPRARIERRQRPRNEDPARGSRRRGGRWSGARRFGGSYRTVGRRSTRGSTRGPRPRAPRRRTLPAPPTPARPPPARAAPPQPSTRVPAATRPPRRVPGGASRAPGATITSAPDGHLRRQLRGAPPAGSRTWRRLEPARARSRLAASGFVCAGRVAPGQQQHRGPASSRRRGPRAQRQLRSRWPPAGDAGVVLVPPVDIAPRPGASRARSAGRCTRAGKSTSPVLISRRITLQASIWTTRPPPCA